MLEELAGKARPKVVVSQAKALIESGSRLIAEIVKQKPHCGEVLNAIVRDKDKMIELSHEEIEHQYHQGAALPKLADPMKQQECYEYKELIVHPATVVVLSKANDWSENAKIDMQAEIDEVLAHYENISFLMGDADQAQAR